MQRIIDHIERVKAKPHHVRKKVAFGIAGGATGLVALVWLSASLATGAFAIQGSTFAESTGQAVPEAGPGGDPNLAGAGAARDADAKEPRIEIVNVATTSEQVPQVRDETTIPF